MIPWRELLLLCAGMNLLKSESIHNTQKGILSSKVKVYGRHRGELCGFMAKVGYCNDKLGHKIRRNTSQGLCAAKLYTLPFRKRLFRNLSFVMVG